MTSNDALTLRTEEYFALQEESIYRNTDFLFAPLLVLQWLAAIAMSIWISPRAWIGTTSQIHPHVWAAIFLGGVICSFPLLMIWKRPGRSLTRHTVAIAQMFTSVLFIHLTGGRIETHFHVFGSLAFLAFYRDWCVSVTGSVVVVSFRFAKASAKCTTLPRELLNFPQAKKSFASSALRHRLGFTKRIPPVDACT